MHRKEVQQTKFRGAKLDLFARFTNRGQNFSIGWPNDQRTENDLVAAQLGLSAADNCLDPCEQLFMRPGPRHIVISTPVQGLDRCVC